MPIDVLIQFTAILVGCIAVFLVLLIFAAGVGVVCRLVVDKSLVPDFIAIGRGLRRMFGRTPKPSTEIAK